MKPIIVVRYSNASGNQITTHFQTTPEVQDFVYRKIRTPRTGGATIARHLAYATGNPLHLVETLAFEGHRFTFATALEAPDDCDCKQAPIPDSEPVLFEVPC